MWTDLQDVEHGQESERVIDNAFDHLEEAIDGPVLEPTMHLLLIFGVHRLHSVPKKEQCVIKSASKC